MGYNFFIRRKAVILLSSLLILSTTGCTAKKVEVKQQVQNVKGVQASVGSIVTNVEYSGRLKANQQIDIFPKTAGKVASVSGTVGSAVKKGDLLFTLESKEIEAQLHQQQASLASAQANLQKTKDSTYQQQLISLQQALTTAEINYNDAKDSYERNKKLYDAGAVSKQTLNDAESKLNSQTANYNAAKDNLNLLTQKSGPQSVDAAAAQVQQSAAGVDLYTAQLDNTVITSPISGIISARNIEVGSMATSAKAAFTIIDSSTLIAEVSVPDSAVGKLQIGQTVPVKVTALDNKTLTGTVNTISPDTDSKNQSYTVDIKIDNSDSSLKSGMFIRVALPAEKKENVVTVPNEAIKTEHGVQYVYVVEKGAIKKKSIEIGLANDKTTEVKANLKEGDFVVTEGQVFLSDGQKVNIAK